MCHRQSERMETVETTWEREAMEAELERKEGTRMEDGEERREGRGVRADAVGDAAFLLDMHGSLIPSLGQCLRPPRTRALGPDSPRACCRSHVGLQNRNGGQRIKAEPRGP